MACLKLLLNEKLGLSALYPNNSINLMSTAAVLPLSTAEEERDLFKFQMNLKVQHFKIGLNNFFYQNTRMLREDRRTNGR
jgi:hypothetical protein